MGFNGLQSIAAYNATSNEDEFSIKVLLVRLSLMVASTGFTQQYGPKTNNEKGKCCPIHQNK